MDEVFNVGKTLLLDGHPMSLVTPAGVEAWIDQGIRHSYRYDQVRDPLDGQMKYRCIYEKEGAEVSKTQGRPPAPLAPPSTVFGLLPEQMFPRRNGVVEGSLSANPQHGSNHARGPTQEIHLVICFDKTRSEGRNNPIDGGPVPESLKGKQNPAAAAQTKGLVAPPSGLVLI